MTTIIQQELAKDTFLPVEYSNFDDIILQMKFDHNNYEVIQCEMGIIVNEEWLLYQKRNSYILGWKYGLKLKEKRRKVHYYDIDPEDFNNDFNIYLYIYNRFMEFKKIEIQ